MQLYRSLPEYKAHFTGEIYEIEERELNKKRKIISKFCTEQFGLGCRYTENHEQKTLGDFVFNNIFIDYKALNTAWPKTGEQYVLIEYEDRHYGGWLKNCKCDYILYDFCLENKLILISKKDVENIYTNYKEGIIPVVYDGPTKPYGTRIILVKPELIESKITKYY